MKLNQKFYIVFDKISGRIILSLTSQNDTLAIRDSLLTMRVPLKDSELYQVADVVSDFDTNDSEIKFGYGVKLIPCQPRFVSWSAYKFPESPAEALDPLGLSDSEKAQILGGK